jgi:aminocarboxymuconate-semialdehyde decarboxylase
LNDCASASAGLLFVGCGWADAALGAVQSGGAPKRREVAAGGRRIRTVDIHSHCYAAAAWELVKDHERENPLASPPGRRLASPDLTSVADRLSQMDEDGIDVQVLGVSPNWYWADRDLARQIIKIQNEKIAEVCAAHPERFVGLCAVALQHPDMAAQQLEEGAKKMGMRGAFIGGIVGHDELSAQKFHPFWAKAEELGSLIFIHPQAAQGFPEGTARYRRANGRDFVGVIGNPMDTTLALSHLIWDGTLDRFPGLKICAAHGGGYLASFIGRSDRSIEAGFSPAIPKLPSEYLKQLYFDTLVYTHEGLRHLIAEVGASQILLGTDFPSKWAPHPVDFILDAPGLSDADRRAILSGNAEKLLRMESKL